jgi:CRP-like cAMP-binding protein
MPNGSKATNLRRAPAHLTNEALEDSQVAQFSYHVLEERFDRHPSWERLGRRLAEEHYIERERREYHLLALDAGERYQRFLEDFPGLAERITQANIASYIGIKPESLSRLHRRKLT